MANIVVTGEDLTIVASQLGSGAADISATLTRLKGAVDALVGAGWQGTASASYQDTYASWNSSATQLHEALTSIQAMLNQAANVYAQTESQLTTQLKQ